ncbi:hypothetical protein A2954_02775 [Candidatus Roizmanbacteria bacterium RIFCSPLOWO2_01_FULL_37_12]|uniref:Glycosyl transferase family 1 domain-containing protein n=1 Tax=Candidatus Roizmanbacteria bacterium RIFCSPLOWO2_01_FULL_37_12 TaxID=1802056 RepID=A0A1F7IAF0_9BACT|nr:MAG: hypothetical protein A3D76_03630 [Candidatus Roizmanbacteria bacterium RIFCSPHIGHO2_02_FULL_37_9b]OGK40302.1 MAG: hypothetical protein A2954_02775 [Candidatus Roizmanbacteria bacterium RIFCSPLOWO2_01_FULL_37_12]
MKLLNNKTSILFLNIYGGGFLPGGTEIFLKNLLKEIRENDKKSKFFLATFNKKNNIYSKYVNIIDDSYLTRFLENYTVLKFQYSYPILGFITFLWGIVWLYRTANKILAKEEVNLIYSNGGILSATVAYLLFRKKGIKYLLHFHGLFGFTELFNNKKFLIKNYLLKKLARSFFLNSKGIIANSNDVADDISGIKELNLRSTVINCFTDTKLFRPLGQIECRNKLHLPSDCFIIVSSNRLESDKRIDFLINIAESMRNNNIKFLFIGDGHLRTRVMRLSQKYKNIIWKPQVDNKMLPYYLNAADITWGVCSLSYLSLTAIESLACGKPIMASEIPVSNDLTFAKYVDPETIPPEIGYLLKEEVKSALKLLNYLKNNRKILKQKEKYCLNHYSKIYGQNNIKRLKQIIYNN